LRRTFLCRRIVDACSYTRDRGHGAVVEEHLKSLADLCADQLHRSYAMVRTVTWAVPILGFLGTVIGITLAIANITPDQLDSSLSSVTGGLAVAFDTTALALSLSLVLVFTSFIVERSEQQILSEVEEFAIKRLATCLATPPAQQSGTLASAEAEAARQLLDRTESLIDWQTKLWQESLESTRQAWSQTLATQQQELDSALQSGMAATLSNHASQLDTVRGEFLQAFQTVAADMAQHRAGWVQAQQQLDATFRENTQRFLQELSAELLALRDGQASDIDRLTQTLSQRVAEWQLQLETATQASGRQLEELRRQGELLLQIVGQESELARLETRLSENLEVVRAAETFEETMHNLSAAVNLLTARARPRAA
jgi:flagellar motor component MotA